MSFQRQNGATAASALPVYELGDDFEPLVLRLMLLSPSFLSKYRSLISDDLFRVPTHAYLSGVLCRFYDDFREIATRETASDLLRQSDYKDRADLVLFIRDAQPVDNEAYVADRLLKWARWSKIDQVIEADDRGDPRKFAGRIDSAARLGEHLLGEEAVMRPGDIGDLDPVEFPRIATPWPWLNDRLGGGPELGDFALLDAFVNVGKTALLVNVSVTALAQGEIVVYGTFEDGEAKIKRRFMQNIADMTKDELLSNREEAARRMHEFLDATGGVLVIKRLRNRRTTVADFASYCKSVEDREGRPVRFMVSDYADRFAAPSRRIDPRHEYREIYEECKLAAMDQRAVHWTGTQANRSAKGKDVVGLEFVGESLGKIEGADWVFGVGQTEEDVHTGMLNLFTAKMREGQKHEVLRLVAEMEKQRIYEG